jgi:hypothetical protein
MRHRTVYYIQGDIGFGYRWHEQGLTYTVGSHYFGGVTKADLAQMVRSMWPV